jgi:hypothetical protein
MRQAIGKLTLPAVASLGLEPVDEIDHVIEPTASSGANAASGDGDRKMGLAGTSAAHQRDVALLSEKAAAGEVIDQRRVDGRALELEVIEVLR